MPVTETDLRANRHADELAKRGAAVHRVPEAVRTRQREAEDAATWVARAVGLATWAANKRAEAPRRDAEPDQGWRRRKQRQPRRRPRPAPREARLVALGGHRLDRVSDGWKCAVCLSNSSDWRRIAPQVCTGAAADRWAARAKRLAEADGHLVGGGTDGVGQVRFLSYFTTWCDKCGAYADSFAVGLARLCLGRPTCAGKEQQLRRLRRGRHPVTNVPFYSSPIPEPTSSARRKPRTLRLIGSSAGDPPPIRGATGGVVLPLVARRLLYVTRFLIAWAAARTSAVVLGRRRTNGCVHCANEW